MSIVDHIGHLGRVATVACDECGAIVRRRDAFLVDGAAFCCVLHEVEHFVRTV